MREKMKHYFLASLFTIMTLPMATSAIALTPEASVKEIADNLVELNPITWTASAEKYHMVVFIDNECSYCSDVVKKVQQYTDAGLTMSFLTVAPPAIHDKVISDMARVWCSSSPRESLRNAMAGFLPDNDTSPACIRTIEQQSALADRVGIEVTPVMVVMQPSPVVFIGNVKPAEILKALKH